MRNVRSNQIIIELFAVSQLLQNALYWNTHSMAYDFTSYLSDMASSNAVTTWVWFMLQGYRALKCELTRTGRDESTHKLVEGMVLFTSHNVAVYNVHTIRVQNGCLCPGYTAWTIFAFLHKWARHIMLVAHLTVWKGSSRSVGNECIKMSA
jgi:hypothetical protein